MTSSATTSTSTSRTRRVLAVIKRAWDQGEYVQQRLLDVRTGYPIEPGASRR
jgi:hypothetical protein